MAVSKLANSVKQEILRLYCETDATTTQLAKQFGISSSTVLRLLQDMMSPEDYREIVAQKNQMKGRRKAKVNVDVNVVTDPKPTAHDPHQDNDTLNLTTSQMASEPDVDIEHPLATKIELPKPDLPKRLVSVPKTKTAMVQLPLAVETSVIPMEEHSRSLAHNLVRVLPQESLEEAVEEIADEIADELSHLPHNDDHDELAVDLDKIDEMVGDDFGDDDDDLSQPLSGTLHLTDDLVDDLEELEQDDEDLEDAEEDEDFDESAELDIANLGGAYLTGYQRQEVITILPLNEADLPLTCYMVVDKAAEIVTRPLREFQDLGMIPDEENSSRTVPVFGNHRVARRFSNHNQRVIKFPGDLIYATQDHLVKKGITRLFFDGNVYSLN